jgi:hypothetical protein
VPALAPARGDSSESSSSSSLFLGMDGSPPSAGVATAAGSLPLDGSVIKMKGLPFKATAEDVCKFFASFSLSSDAVYLRRHPDGRPNGEVRALCRECAAARD